MNSNSTHQPSSDQKEFDNRMRVMSDAQRKAMVKGLGDLARSKVQIETSSSAPDTNSSSSKKSDCNEPR